ncbi:MAG: YihA family ribosome biogenesis GTP-binding protein [Desulfobacteraceae bacterium 4572_130]|nr:MAG: YihA family ribosome biogenesis GTP-binding protein [Desulfobacteraceae bacterium 4572_130]
MIIKQSEFVKSATKPSNYPDDNFSEIAFAGRSNVGKSSLINTLLNRKKLVKTSSRPGCTQLINFFKINEEFFFVDLPGYGYAKVSKKVRFTWGPMIQTYLANRNNLMGVIFLMDIRRDPREQEFKFIDWLFNKSIPVLTILTKADKISKNKQPKQVQNIAKNLQINEQDIILFSAKSKLGKNSILNEIKILLG